MISEPQTGKLGVQAADCRGSRNERGRSEHSPGTRWATSCHCVHPGTHGESHTRRTVHRCSVVLAVLPTQACDPLQKTRFFVGFHAGSALVAVFQRRPTKMQMSCSDKPIVFNRSDKLFVAGIHRERALFSSRTPDRVYILKGFPATETDAAQFLEENNAYYTAPTKKRKSAANPPLPRKPDNRPAFLSSLDAVVQLTTRYEKLWNFAAEMGGEDRGVWRSVVYL